MKAFVTGSTGLLGNNVVRHLVAQGHSVKALARSSEKTRKLFGDLDVEVVVGDMEDIPGFEAAMAGCDVVFHTAAYFREYYGTGDHWHKLEAINVQGTVNLLDAAEAAGVGKVIYVSSSGVIGATPTGEPGDETTPPDENTLRNLYFRSKVLAEERITDWLKTHHLPVVLILPAAIFGPGDAAPTTIGQLIVDFLHGELPIIPPGGLGVIDARDVAQSMLAAVDKGRSGERYIIRNRYASIKEILNIIAKISGQPMPRIRPSYPVMLAFAQLSEWGARLTGNDPLITVGEVHTLNSQPERLSDKARQELEFAPRPVEDTLRDEVMWFVENGYIRTELPALQLMMI